MPSRLPLAIILMAPVLLTAQAQPPEATTVVDPIEAVAPVPVPKVGDGAAMFTPDQLKEYAGKELAYARCWQRGGPLNRTMYNLAVAAEQATLAAEKARKDMALGLVGQDTVDQTELARQRAVRAYIGEIKAEELPKFLMDIPNVTVLKLDGDFLSEDGKTVFALTGLIRNDKRRPVDIPHLTVTLMDSAGYTLYDRAIQPTVKKLQPGETKQIAFRLDAAPAGAALYRISHAPRDSFRIVGPCGLDPRRQLLGWYAREFMAFASEQRNESLKVVRGK